MEQTDKLTDAMCGGTQRDRRNQLRVTGWTLAWVVSWLLVLAALRFDWLAPGILSSTAAVVTALVGVGLLLAYRRFLRQADELRRKIELEALAMALGVGMVGGLTYWLLELAGAVPEGGILVIVFLLAITYGLGVLIGKRRYA